MWKPGNLVTIEGVVYRVKHNDRWNICGECALNSGSFCAYPYRRKQYLVPDGCHLERVSPKMKLQHEQMETRPVCNN